MAMNHKATPELWANVEQAYEPTEISPGVFVGDRNLTIAACLLELRTRVEALEAARRPTPKVYDINEPLELTPEQEAEIAALLRPNSKPTPNPSQIRSSLVERLMDLFGHHGDGASRAAIREVAAWLRSEYPQREGFGTAWANLIEQEADRG